MHAYIHTYICKPHQTRDIGIVKIGNTDQTMSHMMHNHTKFRTYRTARKPNCTDRVFYLPSPPAHTERLQFTSSDLRATMANYNFNSPLGGTCKRCPSSAEACGPMNK